MTEKHGYFIGIISGLIIYAFSNPFVLGGYLSYQIQTFLDYAVPILSISAIIIGGAIVFKIFRVKTTSRGILFGVVGTVAIMEWVIGPFLLT